MLSKRQYLVSHQKIRNQTILCLLWTFVGILLRNSHRFCLNLKKLSHSSTSLQRIESKVNNKTNFCSVFGDLKIFLVCKINMMECWIVFFSYFLVLWNGFITFSSSNSSLNWVIVNILQSRDQIDVKGISSFQNGMTITLTQLQSQQKRLFFHHKLMTVISESNTKQRMSNIETSCTNSPFVLCL